MKSTLDFIEKQKMSHPLKSEIYNTLLQPTLDIEYLPSYDKIWGPLAQAREGDACFDLRAVVDTGEIDINPGRSALIPNGVIIAVPPPFMMIISMRSGWAKKGLSLANGIGVIDQGYRGEICTLVRNLSPYTITIESGMRISQATLLLSPHIIFNETKVSEDYTERGSGGFGHTGY